MIRNLTQKVTISQQERYATTPWQWMWGLMFRSRQNLVMVFPTSRKISLHMWFVFFHIDVLIVDEQRKIVEIKLNFRPWTLWHSTKPGKYLVELGVIGGGKSGKYTEGDVLEFLKK